MWRLKGVWSVICFLDRLHRDIVFFKGSHTLETQFSQTLTKRKMLTTYHLTKTLISNVETQKANSKGWKIWGRNIFRLYREKLKKFRGNKGNLRLKEKNCERRRSFWEEEHGTAKSRVTSCMGGNWETWVKFFTFNAVMLRSWEMKLLMAMLCKDNGWPSFGWGVVCPKTWLQRSRIQTPSPFHFSFYACYLLAQASRCRNVSHLHERCSSHS